MNIVVDSSPPKNAPLSAKYKRSFAYPSMKDRLPIILSKLVDNLCRNKQTIIETYGEESQEELKSAIGEISQLKNHLQTGKPFEKFTSSDPDTKFWNGQLEELSSKGVNLNYYEADWLFAECYLYRKIREIFATKECLRHMDPFSFQKSEVLVISLPAISSLVDHIEKERLLDVTVPFSVTKKYEELCQLFKCSLWANRLDMSLSGGSAPVQQDLLGEVHKWDNYIVINDLSKVLAAVLGVDGCDRVVDIITDNTGLEILCDLCLADYLVTRCNIKKLNFRVKPLPWYVSDVMAGDLYQTIHTMQSHPDPTYKKFGDRWKKFIDTGVWNVKSDIYWCLGLSYCEMADCAPELYKELSSSSLIIFKGDLNYRKLLQDLNWEPTTPFDKVLGKFHPAPLVTLRTCKADLICGLEKGVFETMNANCEDWLVSGNFAVVQFWTP